MITFELDQEYYDGSETVDGVTVAVRGRRRDVATATWDERQFRATSNRGATCELARLLVAAGCPEQPWQGTRNGARVLFGPSLHDWARWTYTETRSGPKRVRWHPYTGPARKLDGE
jgi:hypothetical protein